MRFFQHATLRQKLTWLTAICSVVALATTAVTLGAYEWFFYRRTTVSHLATLSSITARNSTGALAFANPEEAARILAALDAELAIAAAALYGANGQRMAMYRRAGVQVEVPDTAPPDGTVHTGGGLEIAVPVMEVKRFGTLFMRADLGMLQARLAAYGFVLLGTTLVSGLLAYLLTGWLSQRIVAPVQALAAAAANVKTKSDYRVRVPKADDDELGMLTDAFNAMLARVEENEGELQRSAERLRIALDAARIGTWDWNLVRDEVLWNDRNYDIFGVPRGMPITSGVFFSLVHPDDRPRVASAIEAAISTGTDFSAEFRLVQPAQPLRHAVARGLFLKSPSGETERAVGVTIDITERRAAELRTAESEVRFRAMAERAPAMIWSCDPLLNRDYVNKTLLAFTGRTAEQELGRGWQSRLPPADAARWREVVGAAAAQRDPYSLEYRVHRADGALRWVFETGSPRLSADGSFAGYLGSCIDITARKENEAELEAHVQTRTRELEAANQELESFSYSVSHDLRGPVRAIQGFAEIALEECQAGSGQAAVEYVQRIMRAGDRMNKLIDAFIGLARISRFELTIETVNLSRIADETVGFLRASHPDRAVDLRIAPGLECRGDERLLRIVLENLLGNAWKFTARTARAQIEFGARDEAGGRVFFVRDNGAGFNAARAHKLFHAFERLHHAAQFEGLGVGLSSVQRALLRHNGRVWAEGAEGEGATFYFTVPNPPAESPGVRAA